MKRGFLVVNNFLNLKKFQEIEQMLVDSAKRRGMQLVLKRTGELLCPVGGLKDMSLPDFALFWDKDVALCSQLEKLIPTFNSASAIYNCDNKIATSLALDRYGVPTPKTIIAPKTFEGTGYSDIRFLSNAVEMLGLPIIIKEAYGSFGQQVYLANSLKEAQSIVKSLGCKDFLMQEFISQSSGRDVRVNIVGGNVICCMLRENKRDFRSNITGGGSASAYEITFEQAAIALEACRAVGTDFCGVDLLLEKNLVCEVNSNPHFKSTFDCTGIDLSDEILAYIEEKLK